MRFLLLPGLLALIALGGCGGGGMSGQVPSPSETSITLGNARVQYSGSARPALFSSSGNTSSVAMSGALFTSFLYEPPKNTSTLPLLLTDGGGLMYVVQNFVVTQISTLDNGYVYSARYTPTGQILYVAPDTATSKVQLWVCNGDGTGSKRLSPNSFVDMDTRAVMSPDGTKIIFDNKSSHALYVCTFRGDNVTALPFQGSDPDWAPDSTTIVYKDYLVGGISKQTILGTNHAYLSLSGSNPVYASNGNAIAYYGTGRILVTSTDGTITYGTSNAYPLSPSFTADSRYMTFMTASGLVTGSWISTNSVAVAGLPFPAGNTTSVSWAPFLKPKHFLGASATVQSSAAGFVLSQSNDAFTSFFAFSAATPSSASITPAASGGGSTSVYTVAADAITLYRYVNGYSSALVSVTPAANTRRMLVSINSNNGFVGFIAPFLETRSVGQSSRQGDRLTYHAQFSGVFDAKGKNLAPHGASDLTVDVKTGKLLSMSASQ